MSVCATSRCTVSSIR